MANSNQGGSILSFLVVGGVLGALLIGGAYFVQHYTERSNATQSPIGKPATESTGKAENKTTPAVDDDKATAEPQKEEAPKPAPQPAPQATAPSASELPQTGPTESVIGMLAAGLLTFVVLSYLRSRHKIRA